MAKRDNVSAALKAIEPELYQPTEGGTVSMNLITAIRDIRKLLAKQETRWVNADEAQRLLGATVDGTVPALIRGGHLRSRTQPDGSVEVPLDDVLREREIQEGLLAIGGRDLTEEELEEMHRARPGILPWEREQTESAR